MATEPSVPRTDWVPAYITDRTASIEQNTCASDGGSLLTGWDAQYNVHTNGTDHPNAVITTHNIGYAAIPITNLLPYTIYDVRIRAKNAVGYGIYSGWKSFMTLPSGLVNIDGVWTKAQPWVNVDGVWMVASRYVNVDGVWKL